MRWPRCLEVRQTVDQLHRRGCCPGVIIAVEYIAVVLASIWLDGS